jgi:hypothetical protein
MSMEVELATQNNINVFSKNNPRSLMRLPILLNQDIPLFAVSSVRRSDRPVLARRRKWNDSNTAKVTRQNTNNNDPLHRRSSSALALAASR